MDKQKIGELLLIFGTVLFVLGAVIIITRQSPADEKGRVTRISAGKEPGRVGVDFLPGFPNLHDLPKGNSSAGQWSIRIRAPYQAGRSGHMLEKQRLHNRWRHSFSDVSQARSIDL